MTSQPSSKPVDLNLLRSKGALVREFGSALDLTPSGIDEQIRRRRTNGLLDSGAIVERRTQPNQRRFTVFFHIEKYARWLSDPVAAVREERERNKAPRKQTA